MFEPHAYSQIREVAGVAAGVRSETGLATGAQVCDALRDVQAAQDMLDGIRADLLARLEDTDGYETEGASTVAGWAKRELRLTTREATQHRKAGRTLQTLPDAAAALAEGRIRLEHVHELTAGITKTGADVMIDAQHILLPVAETSDPKTVRDAVEALDDIVHPDKLNDDYAKGMDRRDLKAAKCGTGWHISGFLDQRTGTLFHTWLKSASKPEDEGDHRAPSERRVDAFGRLLDPHDATSETAPATDETVNRGDAADDDAHPRTDESDVSEPEDGNGGERAPSGNGTDERTENGDDRGHGRPQQPSPAGPARRRVRPAAQLLVLADLDTLLRVPGAEPATLAGFGPIGTDLLGYLTCTGETTGLLTDGTTAGPTPQAKILNVGRTSRLATRAQKYAVRARQDDVCANPGCHLTHLEYHHVSWWDRDHGRSDLDNLLGLCSRCHHLVHAEKLIIHPDSDGGHTFHRTTGRRIDDHTRTAKRRVRDALTQLRHTAAQADANTTEQASSRDREPVRPRPTPPTTTDRPRRRTIPIPRRTARLRIPQPPPTEPDVTSRQAAVYCGALMSTGSP